MQPLAKFKTILHVGFRDTLNSRKFKVALNPMDRFVYTLPNVASYLVDYNSILQNGSHRTCFGVIGTLS